LEATRLSLADSAMAASSASRTGSEAQGPENSKSLLQGLLAAGALASTSELDSGSVSSQRASTDADSEAEAAPGEASEAGLRVPYVVRAFHRRMLDKRPADRARAEAAIHKHYLELTLSAGRESDTEAQAAWLRTLFFERENLDQVMRELREDGTHAEALAFCSGIWVYWYVGGCSEAERAWIREVVERGLRAPLAHPQRLASAAHGLGVLLYGEGELQAARDYLRTSARLYLEADAPRARAAVLQHLALVLSTRGELEEARRCRDESDALNREERFIPDAGLLQNGLTRGYIERSAGRLRAAYSLFRHSDRAFRRAGRPDQQRMHALMAAGECALALGMHGRADGLLVEALSISEAIGSRANISAVLDSLGRLDARRGDVARARSRLIQSLLIARELSEQGAVIISLCNLAELELGLLDVDKASFLLREAARLAERVDDAEGLVYVALLVVECGVCTGDARLLERGEALLDRAGSPEDASSLVGASYLRARAWLRSVGGEPEAALDDWLASARAFAGQQDAYETLRALERLGIFLRLVVGFGDGAGTEAGSESEMKSGSSLKGGSAAAFRVSECLREAIGVPRSEFEAGIVKACGWTAGDAVLEAERWRGGSSLRLRVEVEALLDALEADSPVQVRQVRAEQVRGLRERLVLRG
jgi:tetratricopeptide (TPR) repeat protein